jgi:hypothetical protein
MLRSPYDITVQEVVRFEGKREFFTQGTFSV